MVNLSQSYLLHMGSVTDLSLPTYMRNQFQDQVKEQNCYEIFPNPCKWDDVQLKWDYHYPCLSLRR